MAPTSSERPWDRRNPWRYVSVASRQNRVESLFTSLIIMLYITFLPLIKITHIFTIAFIKCSSIRHLLTCTCVCKCMFEHNNESHCRGDLSKMVWAIQLCLWWEERCVHPSRAFRTHWGSFHSITEWEVSFWWYVYLWLGHSSRMFHLMIFVITFLSNEIFKCFIIRCLCSCSYFSCHSRDMAQVL